MSFLFHYIFAQYQYGWSALLIAAQKGHQEITELLLNNGAAVDLQTKVLVYGLVAM